MEEKYNGTFEYISGRNFNNGLNGEGFLQGKEYLFKDEESILFSGYSVTSRTSPDILSTGKDTMISDNYIQKLIFGHVFYINALILISTLCKSKSSTFG